MDQVRNQEPVGAVLVVGAGIGGIQASLDLADSGYKVYLLESSPAIGGTMPRLDKTFPTNDCSMCILSPKLVEAGRHLNIELLTYSDLESVEGEAGHFYVRVKRRPRYVDPDICTGCGLCAKVDVPDLAELVEHDGELWVKRIVIDEVKCVQCGDCSRACAKENPDAPAMSSVRNEQLRLAPVWEGTGAISPTAVRLNKLQNMDMAQRLEYWRYQMSKCLKCYGCRDICPVFIEEEFRLEEWAQPGVLPPDAPLYHLARAYYIASRCTHCGFCEETCPGKLPLRTLVDLIRHEDPEDLFEFVPGLTPEQMDRLRTAAPVPEGQEERA
ncbi:MAG: 4Fe-4S dicluster domain-containing protein [Chloroflexi bacterium]|nr:4Fe-4S dicluster domain-containing protein [Chloroflexota bacterium]